MNEFNTEENFSDSEYIAKACEAVLFACGSAVGFDKLAFSVGASAKEIPQALELLKKKYEENGSAIELLIFESEAQLVTKSEYADIVRTALELRRNQPLSRAALEVLAVIAYNQPVTRAFIDKVRGVESPSVAASLAEKGLIEEVGRLDAPGHPILYGTTAGFLRTFGLTSIDQLEKLPELEEIRRSFEEQNAGVLEGQQRLDLSETGDGINVEGEPDMADNSGTADVGADADEDMAVPENAEEIFDEMIFEGE